MKLVATLKQRQQSLDIREAFNVWDILNSKYLTIERLLIWENVAHDLDLKSILAGNIKLLNDNVSILEDLMQQFGIKSPDRNRVYSTFPAGQQIVSDEFIALDLFLYLQEHVENMSKVLRSTVTNDSIRKTIKQMLLKTIDQVEPMVKYLTLKGWLATPPLYKHVPANINESLGLPEASNLWDHVTLRYDNIRTTEFFLSAVHDVDFKAVLTMGLGNLHKQTKLLEEKLQYYGIPMPRRPAKVTLTLTDTETLDDDYMYRILANALQGAAVLHAQSYKECVVNDGVRAVFKQLLKEEIDYIDQLLKYGKMKGWLNPMPIYGTI